MKKSLIMLGALAALGAAAPAAAVTGVSQCGSGVGCAIAFDGTAGTFRNSEVVSPSFTDIFTFDISSAGFLNLTLSTSYPGNDISQDIDFSNVNLSGPGGVNLNLMDLASEPVSFFSASNIAVTAGQYTLSLLGTAGNGTTDASYAGTLNFTAAAVPEPMTWALLAVGFGMVGGALRNRRRVPLATA